MNKKTSYILRYFLLFIGLFFIVLGVSVSAKAGLGTSPISSVPYTFSKIFPMSLGTFTLFFNILLIALQILILRKQFKLIQLLQLPIIFVFSFFSDFTFNLLSGINPTNYISQWLFCILSFFLVALGVFCEVKADVIMLSGEGLVIAISYVTKKEFGKIKIIVDSSLV